MTHLTFRVEGLTMNEKVELQLLSMMLVDDTKFTLRNGGVFDFEGAIKQAEEYAKDGIAEFMKQSRDNVREVALYLHKIEMLGNAALYLGK